MAVTFSTDTNRVRRFTLHLGKTSAGLLNQPAVALVPRIVSGLLEFEQQVALGQAVQVGATDHGYRLQIEIKATDPDDGQEDVVSIPSDAVKKIVVEQEGKVVYAKEASFTNSGTDGLIEWEVGENDLSVKGQYSVHAEITDSGFHMSTEKGHLIVI